MEKKPSVTVCCLGSLSLGSLKQVMITVMRVTHSGRTSPTELTFGSTDSWDPWRPHMAWMSTDSRWTFTKNNTTCRETTSKLIFYFFKYFFQLASVLVMSLFYIHFPISVLQVEYCEGYLQLKRLTSFPFTSHT